MRPNSYQRLAMKTDCYNDIREATLGLASEAGEVSGKISKAYRDNHGMIDGPARLALMQECGDVLWQLTKVVDYFGYELEDIMKMNIEKLADRSLSGVIGGSGDDR